MENIVFGIIILLVVGAAIFYIIKHRKEGAKCMGCPNAKACASKKCNCKSK